MLFQTFKDIIKSACERKKLELENTVNLIQFFNDYEKQNLIDIIDDESELVFFYSKNTDLCSKAISMKEGLKNPFSPLVDWINEEDVDLEAMIESIKGIVELNEKKKKLVEKKENLEKEIMKLHEGKSSFSAIITFKNKKEDLSEKESIKSKTEIDIKSIDLILTMTSSLMLKTIENFKKEKLSNYHLNLKNLADIQVNNSDLIGTLWKSVSENNNLINSLNTKQED